MKVILIWTFLFLFVLLTSCGEVIDQSTRENRRVTPILPSPSGTVVHVSTVNELESAVRNLKNGTTIMIASGTYNLTGTLQFPQGISNVGLRGVSGNAADVVIRGQGMTGGIRFGVWMASVSGVTFADFTLRDFSEHGFILNADVQSPVFHNIHVVDAATQLIKSNPGGALGGVNSGIVEYCVLEYTTHAPSSYTNAVDVHTGSNWIIRNNVIRNIRSVGDLAGPAILLWNHSTDTLIENNTFINNQRDIALGLDSSKPDDHLRGIIRNNIIYRNANIGADVAIGVFNSANTKVLHNTIKMNGGYPNAIEYRFSGSTGVLISYNLTDAAIISRDGASATLIGNINNAQNAWFKDPLLGDFHLLSTVTAAIDKALVLSDVTTDYDGESRPSGSASDIGADEISASSAPIDTTISLVSISSPSNNATVSGSVSVPPAGNVGSSSISVLVNNQVASQIPLNLRLDLDTDSSPVENGYTRFSLRNYSSARGYGWKSISNMLALNRSSLTSETDLTRDIHSGTLSNFLVDLPVPGSYSINTILGDAKYGRDISTIVAEGKTLVSNISTAQHEFKTVNFNIDVLDGRLELVFDGRGGVNNRFAVAAIEITLLQPKTAPGTSSPPNNSPAPPPADATAPTIQWSSPAVGSVVSGVITLQAAASDNVGVVGVQFFLDGNNAVGSEDFKSPYSVTIDSKLLVDGTHTFMARARDAAGNIGTTSIISLVVNNSVPDTTQPTVTISSPLSGASLSGNFLLQANASDNIGVIGVRFAIDSGDLGEDTVAPYEVNLSTANYSVGAHTLKATSRDAAGNSNTNSIAVTFASSSPPPPTGVNPMQQPLVQQGDLQYVGSFLLPNVSAGPSRFGYGGRAPAYYKDSSGRETLYMEGHDWWPGHVAQIQIPTLVNSSNMSSLNRAGLLQPFVDITEGKLGGMDGDKLGSLLMYNGKLIVNSYVYYDAGGSQQRFIGRSGLNLTTPNDFMGFYAPTGINPGKLGTYTTTIPSEWHSLLGGPALNGACCLSIISRTNSGPGISVFDPDHVGTVDPIPFKELIGYTGSHPLQFNGETGNCASQNGAFNCTTNIRAVAFPAGRRSVLFFGTHGDGPVCYKDTGPSSCHGSGGYNAPPYRTKVWAYDANDLLLVKNGSKQPWEISPYAIWTLGVFGDGMGITGGTFDPATNRLFIIESNGEDPIVHVVKIQ